MRASERECHGVDGAQPCRLGTTAGILCRPRGDAGERSCRCSSACCNPQCCRSWLVAEEAAHWCNSSLFSRQALLGSQESSAVRDASHRITACTDRTAPVLEHAPQCPFPAQAMARNFPCCCCSEPATACPHCQNPFQRWRPNSDLLHGCKSRELAKN